MTALRYILLVLIIVPSSIAGIDQTALIKNSVRDYYSSLLNNRVIEWNLDFRRCPSINSTRFKVLSVRGENEADIPRGNRLCWVDVIIDGREKAIPVTVSIKTREMLPVAKCDIPLRTILTGEMVEWRSQNTDMLRAAKFPKQEQLESFWSKVHISEGAVISLNKVKRIPAVKIGEKISIISRSGLVEIVATGKALEDGIPGEKVRVMYTENKKRLTGIVQSNGSVLVE